jgi:hypothetical protein
LFSRLPNRYRLLHATWTQHGGKRQSIEKAPLALVAFDANRNLDQRQQRFKRPLIATHDTIIEIGNAARLHKNYESIFQFLFSGIVVPFGARIVMNVECWFVERPAAIRIFCGEAVLPKKEITDIALAEDPSSSHRVGELYDRILAGHQRQEPDPGQPVSRGHASVPGVVGQMGPRLPRWLQASYRTRAAGCARADCLFPPDGD